MVCRAAESREGERGQQNNCCFWLPDQQKRTKEQEPCHTYVFRSSEFMNLYLLRQLRTRYNRRGHRRERLHGFTDRYAGLLRSIRLSRGSSGHGRCPQEHEEVNVGVTAGEMHHKTNTAKVAFVMHRHIYSIFRKRGGTCGELPS